MALGFYLRQLGIDPVEERLFDVKNVRLEVTSCGTGDKVALCLHGFPEHAYSWRHQVPMLMKLGYRVWVPNLRGYGRSDKPKGVRQYTLGELVQDVAGLLDIAKAKEVVLIGHDWGAMIAWEFALRRVRPIDRLVIMNVPHPAIFAERVREPYQRKRSWYMWFFQVPFVPEFTLRLNRALLVGRLMKETATVSDALTREVLHVYRDNALRHGAMTAMINYYRANFFRKAPEGLTTEPDVPVIDIPALMIWGEDDTALDLRLVPGTDKYVRHLTVKTLPDVAHWVQQEAPQQVNDILQAWLETPEAELTAPEPTAMPSQTASSSFTDVRPLDVAVPSAAYVADAALDDGSTEAKTGTTGATTGAQSGDGGPTSDTTPPRGDAPDAEPATPETSQSHSEQGQDRAEVGEPFEDIKAGAAPQADVPPAPAEPEMHDAPPPQKGSVGTKIMDWIDWRKPRTPETEPEQDSASDASEETSGAELPQDGMPADPVEDTPEAEASIDLGTDTSTDSETETETDEETNRRRPVSESDTLETLDTPRPLKQTSDRVREADCPSAAPAPAATVETPRTVQEPLILTRAQMLSPAEAVQAHIRLLRQRLCFEDL